MSAKPFLPDNSRPEADLLDCGPMAPSAAECLMNFAEPHVPKLKGSRKGRTALHSQIHRGNIEVCRAIQGRPDFRFLNATHRGGSSALHYVVCSGYVDLEEFVVTHQDRGH